MKIKYTSWAWSIAIIVALTGMALAMTVTTVKIVRDRMSVSLNTGDRLVIAINPSSYSQGCSTCTLMDRTVPGQISTVTGSILIQARAE